MSRSGARQWRRVCSECSPTLGGPYGDERKKRMHSQVSRNNVRFFPEEGRVPEDVSEADLERLLDHHDTVLVCNNCGNIATLEESS